MTGSALDHFVHYMYHCQFSVETFWSQHLTCEFRDGSYQCVNLPAFHGKGHQNAKGYIKPGYFESSFEPDSYVPRWKEEIKSQIQDIDRELDNASQRAPSYSKEACMLQIHNDTMIKYYDALGSVRGILSHTTCFCCLMQSPEHALRCGHVLCTQCARAHGQPLHDNISTRSVVRLDCCPLHPQATEWAVPCLIRFKPEYAGVRLLCLDG